MYIKMENVKNLIYKNSKLNKLKYILICLYLIEFKLVIAKLI